MHMEVGTQQRAEWPVSWEMLKHVEGAAKEKEVGESVAWIGLASKLLAEKGGRVHAVY